MTSNKRYSAYIAEPIDDMKRVILDALEFTDWRSSLKKDSVVFVKPNFTFTKYEKGVTTSPMLLKALLELLRGRCSRVTIGESNGGNHSFKAEQAFRGHQMYDICKETGAELVNLSKLPAKFVKSEIRGKEVRIQLPRMLLEEADCFVSVPVMKVHVITGISVGLKNLWGCYPDTMRCLHHRNLDRKLALLAKSLNPRITVVDGLYALDGHGPMFGNPIKMNLILAANNVVVADALSAAIMGIPLDRAKHVSIAESEGIGTSSLEKVRLNTDWRMYRRQFQIRKTLIDNFAGLLFHSNTLAKLVMASPFSRMIYGVASGLRSPEEKEVVKQLRTPRLYM